MRITFSGIGPQFAAQRGTDRVVEFSVDQENARRDLDICAIPANAEISVPAGAEALALLLPSLHPDAATTEELYADPEWFGRDKPEEPCGVEPRVLINGDEWLWTIAHDGEDSGMWMLVPASMHWRAAFRLQIGPDGNSGYYAVVHDPRATITWQNDAATNLYTVTYGRELASVIEELVDTDYDWLAEELAPWCPFCDVEEYWAEDIMLPELFDVTFADDVADSIVADFITKYWTPCATHAEQPTNVGGRRWTFDGSRWMTS